MTVHQTPRPAAFIDRDGTLVEEVNYLSRVADLRLFPFTAEAIQALKERGFWIIVVTNQSGGPSMTRYNGSSVVRSMLFFTVRICRVKDAAAESRI